MLWDASACPAVRLSSIFLCSFHDLDDPGHLDLLVICFATDADIFEVVKCVLQCLHLSVQPPLLKAKTAHPTGSNSVLPHVSIKRTPFS